MVVSRALLKSHPAKNISVSRTLLDVAVSIARIRSADQAKPPRDQGPYYSHVSTFSGLVVLGLMSDCTSSKISLLKSSLN